MRAAASLPQKKSRNLVDGIGPCCYKRTHARGFSARRKTMRHDGDSVRWRRRGSYSNPADTGVYFTPLRNQRDEMVMRIERLGHARPSRHQRLFRREQIAIRASRRHPLQRAQETRPQGKGWCDLIVRRTNKYNWWRMRIAPSLGAYLVSPRFPRSSLLPSIGRLRNDSRSGS